ncbi:non-specific lipid transfer protein GPI-anchored 2-like isoform X2 [Punica granatum]|uniref:Non-specific lipid transfer protein GPI-anchored 2-like isoform X2 n=1 Tax=Punica granatum TaxID=22663 RepID=A0A6P8BMW9_PUNGR|nr:non-specific lipid transfer protein GPI-anchored 2-like isoform X2 [Punica granatum]
MAITRRNELVTDLALAVVLAALLLFHGASAQSGCTSSLLGLTPCLSYVSGNSSTPSSTCCSRLAGIVQSQPQCLCLLFNGRASSSSYNINQTLALALPGACNVQTPPVSRCSSMSPSSPPTSSPADDTPDTTTPTTSSAPATLPGTGSKTVPTMGTGNTSDASINQKLSLCSIAFALLFAPCLSAIFKF